HRGGLLGGLHDVDPWGGLPGGLRGVDPWGDYESLKIAGLIVAAVLCAMGIIILVSGKCKCKFNQKNDRIHKTEHPAGPSLWSP
uniref:FXYD domain-containing ion transport regulator n=2 Tax=Leptobrachium leishanense TaxID=445787 RepID=A0A8C5WCN9_9ANUR